MMKKATAIIQHITYNALDEHYETNVFTDPTIKGKLGTNAMKAKKHLYDHIVYDSTNEQKFAEQLDTNADVAVYVKLPDGFYISTPVGRYNPDWAIAFYEGKVKHIYFVAETKRLYVLYATSLGGRIENPLHKRALQSNQFRECSL